MHTRAQQSGWEQRFMQKYQVAYLKSLYLQLLLNNL